MSSKVHDNSAHLLVVGTGVCESHPVPVAPSSRRLATVLFLDVVGSTAIASDLGDRRWRELQSRFRRAVRSHLKAHGGREEDTAGDGFFATFAEPAQAVLAASLIVREVQRLGIEVRCGLHTGECEFIDGKLGGIAAHIGARVMSLAGASEVMVSSTVRDLVTGSDLIFEDFSIHELKGVPGTWQIFALRQVDGEALPDRLPAALAAERLLSVQPNTPLRRGRWLIATAPLAVIVVIAVTALTAAGSPGRAKPKPIAILSIDAVTRAVHTVAPDALFSQGAHGLGYAVNGALWQATDAALLRRDKRTGAVLQRIPLPYSWRVVSFGFGAVWVGVVDPNDATDDRVEKIDPVSGHLDHSARLPRSSEPVAMNPGTDAMWMVDSMGALHRFDPLTGALTRTSATTAGSPGSVIPLKSGIFVCDCINGDIVVMSSDGSRVVRHLNLPEHGYLAAIKGASDGTPDAYVVDPSAATLTPLDSTTGKVGRPVGVAGDVADAAIGFGAIWIASIDAVYRVDLNTQERVKIPMPQGISAGSIAIDPASGKVFVINCGCPRTS
jgi:class 3 adenylate cyclase/DNA-binding beta-propeller fold protein YncE